MGIKCTFQVPARILSDMDGDDGVLQKEFVLDVIPVVGTKLHDVYLRKAMCRDEEQPIVVEDVTFNLDDASYLVKGSKITIDSNYLDRMNGWGDKQLSIFHDRSR